MGTFSPDAGVNEREPTLIADGALQDTDGAEYRVGQIGLFVARGRDQVGDVGGVTGAGVYEAGFDGSSAYVIAHQGNSLHAAPIAPSLTFALLDNLPSGTSGVVGAHYASRHYVATGAGNRRIELVSAAAGLTSFTIGMSVSTYSIGVSVTQGVGTMSATTGLVYWATEYDSARGIESTTGASVSTGAFSLLDGVVAYVTGVSANRRADQIRWYRSIDGGGFPDAGLVATTAIGTTTITDTLTQTGSLSVPSYGLISIGGLDTERDEAPGIMSTIFGPFQDSLLGVAVAEPRVLRFTPAGYPDSWPSAYGIPLETNRQDNIVTGVVLPGRIGVFCNDSVHAVYRLPRDSDSIFAAGEMMEVVTAARGCMSRRGATVFTPPGSAALAAWVARDGIWVSTLADSPVPVTDGIDWEGRVSVSNLSTCRLLDDSTNRRLIFIYRRATDTTHNTGIWYLDYQRFNEFGMRVTFADHGPLVDAQTFAWTDGHRRALSLDSRSGNGQVYVESIQDVDDSQLLASSGAVRFRMRCKEFMPGDPRTAVSLGKATWMHDAGPSVIEHRFYFNRRDDNPEMKVLANPTERNADDVTLGRAVNSFSLEIQSVGTQSYGVHWIDVEGLDLSGAGAMKGA
jgi:hypothetical protein